MAVRAVMFDVGGVLERPTATDLDGRWERRLGLKPGDFFARLRRSGLGRAANFGRVSETEFSQALGRLYGLDQPTTAELLEDLLESQRARPTHTGLGRRQSVNVTAGP